MRTGLIRVCVLSVIANNYISYDTVKNLCRTGAKTFQEVDKVNIQPCILLNSWELCQVIQGWDSHMDQSKCLLLLTSLADFWLLTHVSRPFLHQASNGAPFRCVHFFPYWTVLSHDIKPCWRQFDCLKGASEILIHKNWPCPPPICFTFPG